MKTNLSLDQEKELLKQKIIDSISNFKKVSNFKRHYIPCSFCLTVQDIINIILERIQDEEFEVKKIKEKRTIIPSKDKLKFDMSSWGCEESVEIIFQLKSDTLKTISIEKQLDENQLKMKIIFER